MRWLLKAAVAVGVLWVWAGPVTAQETAEDVAYQAFQQGLDAYQRADYLNAVRHFEQACRHAFIFSSAYYVWLGSACEQAYDTALASAKAERLALLDKGIDAYRIAFDRKRDPDIHYDYGRMKAKYALECARMVLAREIAGHPRSLKSLPAEVQDTSLALPPEMRFHRYQSATVDSLARLWHMAADGLNEVWEGILARERKERIFTLPGAPEPTQSDTLQAYLSMYIEHCMKLVEASSRVNFVGIEPDFYIPRIAAACRRGQRGDNPEWFNRVLEAVRFDGGYNMRCAIHRVIGLRLSKERQVDAAIDDLIRGMTYARSDTSKGSLYIDIAFTAYQENLVDAVGYARLGYMRNPQDRRIRDTYGGLSLSLANVQLREGNHRKAVATLHPVTEFDWQDRGEALMTLAIAYVNSDLEGVLDKAYQAAEEAYQIDPGRYWKEFRRVAELHGSFAQVLDLERKHGNGKPE